MAVFGITLGEMDGLSDFVNMLGHGCHMGYGESRMYMTALVHIAKALRPDKLVTPSWVRDLTTIQGVHINFTILHRSLL